MKIGIIGTGRHGSRYAHHIIHDLPKLRLVAISRRSALGKDQAEGWGIHYYHDWRDLITDPEVEAVIAVTTPNLNEDIAMACAAARKPVLIEKPLALNAASAVRIVKCCREANISLTVGQTLRYNSTILTLKNELPCIGELYYFNASIRLEKSKHAWLDDQSVAGAGVILHSAVHVFDALRFISGKQITHVTAQLQKFYSKNVEDLFLALIGMEDGITGSVDASKLSPARSGRFEFVGTLGQLHGDQVHGILEFIEGTNISILKQDPPASTIVPLLNDWCSHLTGKQSNPIPGEEGLQTVRICEASLKSAKEGRIVSLTEIPDLCD